MWIKPSKQILTYTYSKQTTLYSLSFQHLFPTQIQYSNLYAQNHTHSKTTPQNQPNWTTKTTPITRILIRSGCRTIQLRRVDPAVRRLRFRALSRGWQSWSSAWRRRGRGRRSWLSFLVSDSQNDNDKLLTLLAVLGKTAYEVKRTGPVEHEDRTAVC